ncbi:MAG: transaldolase [Planctomycetales bacterium]|nr:transaldolase [Planctomycetales bacterium]MCA9204849.1 transaldolase [Planctomycetales bacterium]
MSNALKSLIASGTKLWLDSIDPQLVQENRALGATGATSNPVIVSDLIKTGRFDSDLEHYLDQGLDDDEIAWRVTDQLVTSAQHVFQDVWQESSGDDGYVSFELDPLLEDPEADMPHEERVARYIELGKQWSADHDNRMIKVPATPAGLAALEELSAAGVTLNVTLIFSDRQYQEARDAVWRGAQRRANLNRFKSVYSIFVSRVDVFTEKHVPQLAPAAQGQVGIVNAKRIWQQNQQFWAEHPTPLKQEMIFASTGTKKPEDAPWKYVASFAGSDIETNPPATNQAVAESDLEFARQVDQMPSNDVLADIDAKVDFAFMERVLMEEGIQKFADPQKALLRLIGEKRAALSPR